jgi:hypothetical protein
MNRFTLLTFLLLLLTACEKRLEPGGLVVNDPIRHYYPVVQGEPLIISYEMEDTTDNPIFIQEVQTSCGCIVPRETLPITILPHKKATLNLTFNTIKNTGYVHHYIYCYGNFADTTAIVLEFDTNIVPSADYVRDYEDLWNEQARSNRGIKQAVDGTSAQKGYYTDEHESPRTRRTRDIQKKIDEHAF